MTATPAVVPIQKQLLLDGNGGSYAQITGLKNTAGTLIDFSSGWTFRTQIAPGSNSGPSNASSMLASGSTVTGSTGGVLNLQEPALGGGGIAGTSPTATGTYAIVGSTDSFSTSATLAYGNYGFLPLPEYA